MAKNSNVTRFPNRSPGVTTRMMTKDSVRSFGKSGAFETFKEPTQRADMQTIKNRPANVNVSRKTREAAIKAKYPANTGQKVISGKAAYGPKTKPPSILSRVSGAVGRGLLRGAGPAGALIGMTTPVGVGSDRPPKGIKGMTQLEQAAANAATSAKRPTSSGLNAPARTKPSGSARPTSNSLSAPARTSSSSAKTRTTASSSSGGMRSGPGSTGGSKTSRTSASSSGGMRSGSSGGMRSGPGSTGGSKTSSSSKSTSSRSTGPSRGPTSSPSRTSPSKSNLGTSRF